MKKTLILIKTMEKIFADGFHFDLPNETTKEKAPFIKGKISIKVSEAIEFLKKHENLGGYVNLDLKKSQKGTLYLELNQYKKPEPPKTPTIDPDTGIDVNQMEF
ncbi:MAG: hypothetical protein ACR2IQ_02740 [Minisyncoccia bacterium]